VQRTSERAFAAQKIKVQVSGREKTIYSIYRKMREKHAGFAQVNDIFGFRIVVPTLPECYLALGVLHQLYKPVPGRFKDYIAIPKANGYQSLHTTLVSPLGTAVEFQMRTEAMHAVAEKGIAAHWLYKVNDKGQERQGPTRSAWARCGCSRLLDIQDETRDAAEFLEHVKIDLYPDAVYVFTPKSKILALPRGATPVDFAYAIHSDVGDHTVAAKVNGEPVALRTELRSGDVVEVITAPGAKPNPGWLSMVRTGRARSKIRHYLKNMEQEESRAMGEKMLAQALRAEGLQLPVHRPDRHRRRRGAVAAAHALERQPQPRRTAGRHRPGPQDRDHRRQAPGAADARARHPARRGDADAGPLCAGRRARRAGRGLRRRQRRGLGPAGALLPADPRRRHRRLPGPRRRPARAHRRMPHRQAPVRTRQRTLDAGRMGRRADAQLRDQRVALVSNGKGVLAQVASAISTAEADIRHLDMGPEPADRDHRTAPAAERARPRAPGRRAAHAAPRNPVVLRVSRVKP
jgi:guanosine-3',5'-bis(diphosphate) 3'-pyrophosphohydrolase